MSIQPPSFYTQLLIFLLIIAAFFAGSYVQKLQFQLQTNNKPAVAVAQAEQGTIPANDTVPTQPDIKTPTITDKDYIRGDKNAKITLVEYSDLECPFCIRFHPTMQKIMQDYDGKVRWIYRHYPLPFHANAQKEAEATECVGNLGGNDSFWKYIDQIMLRTKGNGSGFALDQLGPLASEIGINQVLFQKCLDSGQFTQKVSDELKAGSSEGVNGTPGTIIIDGKGNTQFINGAQPYEQIKPLLDSTLAK